MFSDIINFLGKCQDPAVSFGIILMSIDRCHTAGWILWWPRPITSPCTYVCSSECTYGDWNARSIRDYRQVFVRVASYVVVQVPAALRSVTPCLPCRPALYNFLMSRKSDDGGFTMHEGGEVDIRCIFYLSDIF